MGAKLQSWWQKINQHPVPTILMALLAIVIVLIILSILGYIFKWDWTGLSATDFTSTPPNITRTIAYQPGKTLWDWLQLLIIPAVLAVAGYVINLTISKSEQAATEQRAKSEREAAEKHAKTEREIAQDNQRETALQEYIDKMSELLLHENLRNSKSEDEVRNLARVRTLTILRRCNPERKGNVIKFLYESKLILKDDTIVYLNGADLSNADLYATDLSNANLSGANLDGAMILATNLSGANLDGANLTNANITAANLNNASMFETILVDADLRTANLSEAILSGATLSSANMGFSMLKKAKLDWASLKCVYLFGADLSDANLTGAYLKKANLCHADLRCACLNLATIDEADFSEANLGEVDGITVEVLEQKANSLQGATMPDGSIHP